MLNRPVPPQDREPLRSTHPTWWIETVGSREWKGIGVRRVMIEGFVIVASILLAFAIDAWWDTRQQSGATFRTLGGLEAAFSENVSGISRQLDALEGLSERLHFFLESEPGALSRLPADSAHYILTAVHRQGTASLNNEYLTELVDAADLSAYPEIGAAVAEWRRSAFILRERREVLVAQEQSILLEAALHPELIPHLTQPEEQHQDAAGLARLRSSPTAVSHVAVKEHSWRLYAGYFMAMRQTSEQLVEMLRGLRSR